MELVLKIPKDKPPFMGILLYGNHEDGKLNADLVLEHKNKPYRIIIEVIDKHINLRLICDELVIVRFYNHISYNPEKLKSWLYIARNATSINFGHVKIEKDRHVINRTSPSSKPFVLKISKCEVQKSH